MTSSVPAILPDRGVNWRVWTAFVAVCVVWGIPYFFIKVALVELPPTWIAWTRITLGAALLLPIAWHRGSLRAVRGHWIPIVAFAFVELVAPFYLIATGERWITSALAGVLLAAVPMTVLLLAPLFGVKEQLSLRRVLGLATGLAGVVVLLGIDAVHGLQQWLGVLCVLVAMVGYAVGPLILQRYLPGADGIGTVAASLAVGAIALAGPAAVTMPAAMPSGSAVAAVVVLGIFCTALGLVLYVFVVSHAGAARASIVTYINPAIAVVLGVAILNEDFGPASFLGLALILLGSWLSTGGLKKS